MDLDDAELKATRMMNGADRKGRVNKMEQDIEELKRLFYTDRLTQYGKRKLINYYEQQEKDYKRVLKENEGLRKSNKIYALQGSNIKLEIYIKDNYLSKQKVKDRIEEYKNMLKTCNRAKDIDRIKAINERILELEELLEGRKENESNSKIK